VGGCEGAGVLVSCSSGVVSASVAVTRVVNERKDSTWFEPTALSEAVDEGLVFVFALRSLGSSNNFRPCS
jgi:hypothetical protein